MLGPAMVKGVLSREQGNPGGRTDGHAPSRLVPYAFLGQPVDVGGLVLGSVATDPVPSHVINHDEDDVRLLSGTNSSRKKEK